MEAQGQCLCGVVTLKVDLPNTEVAACHCGMCRKWSGAPMLAVDCGNAVQISGESDVVRYQSSEWAERGFCAQCGTHLFYFLKPADQYHVPADLLEVEGYKLTHQIFIEEKPEYYEFANATQNMTGAELFAHFEDQ